MTYLPLFREALGKGDFTTLHAIAIEEPRTTADLVIEADHFLKVLKAAESSPTKWLAALFLFEIRDSLEDRQKSQLKAILINIIIQLASQIYARGIRPNENFLTAFRLGLEEIELEETLENVLGKQEFSAQDIVMVDKKTKKRAVVLMLDVSNSMRYEKLLIALVTVGVFIHKLKDENYSIITFGKTSETIKSIEQEILINNLLEQMLEIKTGGSTNLRRGLETGLEELSKNVAHEKVAILVTDGWVTEGHDPLEVAPKFSKLHVIQVPFGMGGGDTEMCLELAKKGHGKHIYVEAFEDLPCAVIEILK